MTYPGSIILHADGTIAGCTLDEDPEGCTDYKQRHDGSPVRCIVWWRDCNYCGQHR